MVSGFYYFLFAVLHTDSNFSFSYCAHFTPAQHAFTSIQSIKHTGNVIKICLQYGAFVTLYTLVFLKRLGVAGRGQSLTITPKQQNRLY